MKPYQSLSVGPAEPSPIQTPPRRLIPGPGAGCRCCCWPFVLPLAFLSPAFAADGALDPSFITGPGPFAGVQTIPEIKGQVYYPTVTGSPYNGCSLIFGHILRDDRGRYSTINTTPLPA